MSLAQAFQMEMEHEVATTRRFLERLAADQLGFKPHEKSLSAGQLALHIATLPGQIASMGAQDECPPPDSAGDFPQPADAEEVLDALDDSVKQAGSILSGLDDQQMMAPWKLVAGGQELMSMPRIAFFRHFLLNHWYHHRGQFGVYLRLMGAQVPSAYGPSGDEMPPWFEALLEVMAAKA